MTIDQYIWKDLAKWPNKVAIVCGITGRQYTFAQLRDRCAAVAYRLRTEYGLQRGDVIAISMQNEPEFVIAVLGALEAGLVVTTVNPLYTQYEHVKQLVMTRAKLIFGLAQKSDLLLATVAQVAVEQKTTAAMPIVVLRPNRNESLPAGVCDFEELMDLTKGIHKSTQQCSLITILFIFSAGIDFSSIPPAGHRPDDVAVIPFSSGTTGLPKGVELTHRNLTINCEMTDVPLPDERIIRPATSDFQEIIHVVLPFYHLYGLAVLFFSKMSLGCKLITLPRFEPVSYLHALAEHKATFLALVPPLMLFLANDEHVQSRHLANVRMVMCGAASSSESDAVLLRERYL